MVIKYSDVGGSSGQKIYFLQYEQPEILEGWVRLGRGCGWEGCVNALGHFFGINGASSDVFVFPDSVKIELGLLEKMLSAQETCCVFRSLW